MQQQRLHRVLCLTGLYLAALLGACGPMGSDRSTSDSPGGVEAPKGSVLITGVAIVEAEHDAVTAPQDILMVDGFIAQVAPAGDIDPDAANHVVAAEGLFALPGLIDVHAHIGDGGLGAQSQADREGALAQFLRYGVTTIFVPGGGGGNDDNLALWKQRCAAHELPCPRIYGSGALITAPGGHPIGTIWDLPIDIDEATVYARGAVTLAEDEAVEPLLDRKMGLGVDAIKIVIEDGPGPWYPKPRLSRDKILQLVTASHERNLQVFAHVSRTYHVEDALAAGVDGLMHSSEDPIDDSLLRQMAQRRVFFVPTLSLYDGFIDQAFGRFEQEPYAIAGVSGRALRSLEDEDFRHQPGDTEEEALAYEAILQDNLRRAVAVGVPLALGTDVNNPWVFPGYSAHKELHLMVQAGLTPAQALAAATGGGAAFLRAESTLGCLDPGCVADLLLLTHNPLTDILHSRSMYRVFQGGQIVPGVVAEQP